MLLTSVRAQLKREDAALVVCLLTREPSSSPQLVEMMLADHGLDGLLDDPRLLVELREARQGLHASFPLFAYVAVRHALRAAGDDDRLMADYVASVLLHFGLRQRAWQLAPVDDATYDTLAAIGEEVEQGDRQRAFFARVHLGNYALWLSGMFPDHIEQRQWKLGAPGVEYFEAMGQRGFRLAAEHRQAAECGVERLFAAAAARFTVLRVALNSISDQLLFPHITRPERLMRQVRDDARWRRAL